MESRTSGARGLSFEPPPEMISHTGAITKDGATGAQRTQGTNGVRGKGNVDLPPAGPPTPLPVGRAA